MAIESILNSVKKNLGIASDYNVFDPDILMHINTAFFTVTQIGIGLEGGFVVEDADATWADFLGTGPRWTAVRTYTFLRVKSLFDPPGVSYLVSAMQNQIEELEMRLSYERERTDWVSPTPPVTVPDDVIDGGTP